MKRRYCFVWIIAACLILAGPVAFGDDEGPNAPESRPVAGGQAPSENGDTGAGNGPQVKDRQPPADDKTGQGGGLDMRLILFMVAGLVLIYVVSGRGRKKREAKHREMLASLKKGDKVTSIGGVCGTVVEVKEDELVVKVDETNNVRMRFARWAIRGVGETGKSENPEK